jgi:hypothetical protein
MQQTTHLAELLIERELRLLPGPLRLSALARPSAVALISGYASAPGPP